MIHIAAEVTLIAGLGFWMKKRADASDAKIEELEDKLKKYEEILIQQQNLISRHENALRQIFGQPELRGPQEKSLPGAPSSSSVSQPQPQKEPEEEDDIDDILKQELAKEEEKSIEIETVDDATRDAVDESRRKSSSPTALKQRKVNKKKTVNVRTT